MNESSYQPNQSRSEAIDPLHTAVEITPKNPSEQKHNARLNLHTR